MSISSKAVDQINKIGYGLASNPGYEIPSLPRDITELDDEALMDLFVQFTQWTDHLSGAHAIAVIDEREAERLVTQAEATAMLKNWTGTKGGDKVTVLKAQIATSPEVNDLYQDFNSKYAFRKLIETRMLNVERDSQVVSRELTRRTSDGGGMRARTRRFTV